MPTSESPARGSAGMTGHPEQRIGVLDGLRAIAIFLVLCTHGMEKVWTDLRQPYLPLGHFDLAVFFSNCWVGVDLFFVLSGFLITGQLLDSRIAEKEGRWQTIGSYFKRRICRIVPVYYLVLTFKTISSMFYDPLNRGALQWAYSYIPHLLFLQNFFYVDFNPVYWSLALEFQFYLLAPFLILLLLRIERPGSRYIALCVTIMLLTLLRSLAVALHWQIGSADYHNWCQDIRIRFPFSLDGLLDGMLCAFLWRDGRFRALLQRKHVGSCLFFGGLALFLVLAGRRPPLEAEISMFDKTLFLQYIAAAFSCMLLGLLAGSAGQRLFSSRPLRYVALVSYSMYLTHLIFRNAVFNLATRVTYPLHSHFVTYFTGLTLLVIVSVLISTFMYHVVEKPFIDWAKKVPEIRM